MVITEEGRRENEEDEEQEGGRRKSEATDELESRERHFLAALESLLLDRDPDIQVRCVFVFSSTHRLLNHSQIFRRERDRFPLLKKESFTLSGDNTFFLSYSSLEEEKQGRGGAFVPSCVLRKYDVFCLLLEWLHAVLDLSRELEYLRRMYA